MHGRWMLGRKTEYGCTRVGRGLSKTRAGANYRAPSLACVPAYAYQDSMCRSTEYEVPKPASGAPAYTPRRVIGTIGSQVSLGRYWALTFKNSNTPDRRAENSVRRKGEKKYSFEPETWKKFVAGFPYIPFIRLPSPLFLMLQLCRRIPLLESSQIYGSVRPIMRRLFLHGFRIRISDAAATNSLGKVMIAKLGVGRIVEVESKKEIGPLIGLGRVYTVIFSFYGRIRSWKEEKSIRGIEQASRSPNIFQEST
ncbi:hypothetical protein B0H14DRAFT_2566840 [Mycena olivaceomarginata]|nr:hypothetical protein B0H14DRAFT_2566840 [Mycena olivaceomarginata]